MKKPARDLITADDTRRQVKPVEEAERQEPKKINTVAKRIPENTGPTTDNTEPCDCGH